MKNKTKTFLYDDVIAYHMGKAYKIAVYAEVEENDELDGILIQRVKFGAKSKSIVWKDEYPTWIDAKKQTPTRTRSFNMGFAIYNGTDETEPYNKETAIKIAKRRFAKSPMTSQNMRYLNEDMVWAIVKNEANFIADKIHLFLPKENPVNEPSDCTEEPCQCNHYCNCSDEELTCKTEDISEEREERKFDGFENGDYVIFKIEGTNYFGAACIKNYNNDTKIAKCYWKLRTSGDNKYKFSYNGEIINPMSCLKEEIELIDDVLKEKFFKTWDKNSKKFKLVF